MLNSCTFLLYKRTIYNFVPENFYVIILLIILNEGGRGMKKVVLFVLITLFVFASIATYANTINSPVEVQMLAKKHANEDVNKIMPFLGGVAFGFIAPIFQYVSDPQVPANRILEIKEMLAEDQDYLLDVYIQTYKEEVKRIKANLAWLGWATWLIMFPFLMI